MVRERDTDTGGEDFSRLFDPESVAVVGASTDPDTITGRPQHFLEKHGFEGNIYPVNPKHDSIRGLDCYPSVLDVPDDVDVALVLVSSKRIPGILRECGRKGIRYAIVVGSGFGEVGEAGERLERELLDIAAEYGIRVVGPNTLGVIGFESNSTLCFSSMLDERDTLVEDGELAFVSQSGSFAGMLFLMTQRRGIGTKYWASTGNEIDVDALELLSFMLTDSDVSMVVGYVESFAEGTRLEAVAEKALERGVPILLMKVGQSDEGRAAVSSHTGKMAGEYDVYSAVFREYGIVEVEDVTTFLDVISTLSVLERLPAARCQWAALSPSGGVGALVADAVDREGMELATFEAETVQALSEVIPEYGSVRNPVDATGNVIGNYGLYEDAFTALLADDGVDVLLLQFGNTGPKMAAAYEELLTEAARTSEKTILAVFTGGEPPEDLERRYRAAGIPTFTDPVRAVRTVGLITRFTRARERRETEPEPRSERATGGRDTDRDLSDWTDAAAVMDEYGIESVRGRVADSPEEAVAVAEELGYPAVLKASASGLEHKTEADGIRLDLRSAEAVERAFADIDESVTAYDPELTLDGVLVQAHVEDGVEVIVGITESDLGPVMIFGLGGTLVEVLDDVSYRTLPITRTKAEALLRETRAGEVLSGHRGRTYDTDALVELMTGASDLYVDYGLTELDLNPVTVRRDGAVVVDFLAKR
jgi:acyl-CoA synthetase (NDP forming)